MKTLIKLSFGMFLVLFFIGCTKNFEEINTDPNHPAEVTTPTLLTGAMKGLGDDMYDEWWGGRQSMLYAQYWSQRNYTSEDRYAIRESVNNSYFRYIYRDIMNLQEIIRINTDPELKLKAAAYGDNDNQIAVATILKIWAMQIMTDTYGDVPYFDAFKGSAEPTPKYDKQADIYAAFLTELAEAVGKINENSGFTDGDAIYEGDMTKWKKFGNSLRLRVAIRMSGVDNYTAANAILQEVGTDNLLTSNEDNAKFTYLKNAPNNSPLNSAWFTSARNDFYTAKPLIDLLKGVDDTLNNKVNPFHGLLDPRLYVYTKPKKGTTNYVGIPYGMPDAQTQAFYSKNVRPGFGGTPFGYSSETAPVILNAEAPVVFMDYAEVEFMISELQNWNQDHYIAGVTASIGYWRELASRLEGWSSDQFALYDSAAVAYIAGLPPASKETVLAQKYIAFYNQAYQAWAEYRRTGEPSFLLKPGEISYITSDGTEVKFEPLNGLTTIPKRLTYPQQEYTVNGASVTAAASSIGGDEMSTNLWWDTNGDK